MKGRHKIEALVLSRRNSGEADRVLTFFSREHGLVKALAKGVRKIPSRRGGHLEPYTMVLTLLTASRAGNYVGAVETLNDFSVLRERADRFVTARNMVSAVLGFLGEEEPHPEIFDAVYHAFNILPELNQTQALVLEVALLTFILGQAGVMPDLTACQVCGKEQPLESIVLDNAQGGWRCSTCHYGFSGTRHSLPPALLKVLRFIAAYPSQALRLKIDEGSVKQLLSAVRFHVSTLTSQPILQDEISYVSR